AEFRGALPRLTDSGRGGFPAVKQCQEGRDMRALLTSSGIENRSIQDALVDLLGKPIAESTALFIPTAMYPFPGGAFGAWRAICGKAASPLAEWAGNRGGSGTDGAAEHRAGGLGVDGPGRRRTGSGAVTHCSSSAGCGVPG
ncbi:MAG TPA: hypothetical protein VFU36_13580, partial [Jatrophihabitans sp.]|nr:hypothetical protein [Jatrophihabitans sp.]